MSATICPVCASPRANQHLNGATLCPRCGWDFSDMLGERETVEPLLKAKLAKDRLIWQERCAQEEEERKIKRGRAADKAAVGQEIRVNYQVRVRRNILLRTVEESWIELRAEENVQELPPILVALGQEYPPLCPQEGEIIDKIERLAFVDGRAGIKLPAQGVAGYVKLFFQNVQDAGYIRLLPAAVDKLKLG